MEREKMSKETKDEFVRYRQVERIKTQEEYEEAKKRLDYYLKEYTWMQESKNPILEVKQEMEKLLPMLNGEKTESQKYFQKCINLLNSKNQQIIAGEYLTNLKQNITALLVITREFEQKQKEYTLRDIFWRGIIKRDKTILEALKINNIFERIMAFGNVPAEKDLSLQDPEYLVAYIGKYYDLVGIQVPDYQKNLALVPVNSERVTMEQKFILNMMNEYLKENGIENDSASEMKNDILMSDSDIQNDINSREYENNKKQDNRMKREIDEEGEINS